MVIFWWIIKKALENLWCALGVFLVSPSYSCEVICSIVLHFAFTSLYLETQAKYFALGAIGSSIAIDFVIVP